MPDTTTTTNTPRVYTARVNPDKLFALFDRARAHLRRPELRIRINGTDYKVNRSGVNIWIGLVTRDWSSNPWRVLIRPNHSVKFKEQQTLSPDNEFCKSIVKLCRNPEAYLQSMGRLTGSCCYCARQLTDERSLAMGYGPICAQHYGLPWGV